MSLSIHSITVPAYDRGLAVLSRYLDIATAHATAAGTSPDAFAQARLAPDMLTLTGQIQRASDTSKNAVARLLGIDAPSFPDTETTLAELKQRIENTRAFIQSADPAQLDAGVDREITLTFKEHKQTFTGEDYVLSFALPNFYFHVAMVHAILRHQGVAVGKLDYLGAAS